jgi:O-antigen/teichoic acid export membrane protein
MGPPRLMRRALRGNTRVSSRATIYLAGSVATALLSFVTLPLATRILGPANYGVFALGATVAGFGSTLATLGTTFFVGNRFSESNRDERRVLISTLIARTALAASAWAVLTLAAAWLFRDELSFLADVPLKGLALVLFGAVLNTPWVIAIDVLTVEGRAIFFSVSLVLQGVATAAVILLSLYVFGFRGTSLFVGNLAGCVVAFAAAMLVLGPYVSLRGFVSRKGVGQRKFLPTQSLEAVQPLVERTLLANYVGFAQLGNYSHSLAYRNLILQGTNGLSRAVWPVTLAEARSGTAFTVTGRAWGAAHLAVAMVAAPLTLFGDRLISALTNGKLTGAWVFLAPWCIVVILQCTGKPATGILYTSGDASAVARIGLLANAVVLVALVALVPPFGASGAVAAVILQAIIFRVTLQLAARRRAALPFQDLGAIFACALVAILFFLRRYVTSSTDFLIVLLVFSEVLCALLGRKVLRSTFAALFGPVRDAPADVVG